jgi:FkbM family methyltransferase
MALMDAGFRKLPLFKGKDRLAKMIFKHRIAGSKNFLVKGKFGCEYVIPNIVENIGFDIFINGIYEQETSDFIINHLPANGIFLDLGANIGAITIPVYTKRRDARIICVEAAPWIFRNLERNLKHNGAVDIAAINKALYYNDGEILDFYSPEDKFGKGSLSPVFTDKLTKVTTIKVDTLVKQLQIPHVDIIKIDVEGYEYHVFKGASELLARSVAPDIIFEFVDWAEEQAMDLKIGDSQRLLRDLGYQIYYFRGRGAMKEVDGILKSGYNMLYASKKRVD